MSFRYIRSTVSSGRQRIWHSLKAEIIVWEAVFHLSARGRYNATISHSILLGMDLYSVRQGKVRDTFTIPILFSVDGKLYVRIELDCRLFRNLVEIVNFLRLKVVFPLAGVAHDEFALPLFFFGQTGNLDMY